MVAQCGHIVAHSVHEFNGSRAFGGADIGRALAEVTGIHQDDLGTHLHECIAHIGHVGIAFHRAVYVVAVQDDCLTRIGTGRLFGGRLFYRSFFDGSFLSRLGLDSGSFLFGLFLNRSFLDRSDFVFHFLDRSDFLFHFLNGGNFLFHFLDGSDFFFYFLNDFLNGSSRVGRFVSRLRGDFFGVLDRSLLDGGCLFLDFHEHRRHVVDGDRDAAVLDRGYIQDLAVQGKHAVIRIRPEAAVLMAMVQQFVGAFFNGHHNVVGGVVTHDRFPGAQVGGNVNQHNVPAGFFTLVNNSELFAAVVSGLGLHFAVVLNGRCVTILGNGLNNRFAVVLNGRRVAVLGSRFIGSLTAVFNSRRIGIARSWFAFGFAGRCFFGCSVFGRGSRRSRVSRRFVVFVVVADPVYDEEHNNSDQDKKSHQDLLVFE